MAGTVVSTTTELRSEQNHGRHTTPHRAELPVIWTNQDIYSAFSEYLQTPVDSNLQSNRWDLFKLGVIAARARLAGNFDSLVALDHIQGFTPLPHQIETAKRVLQELHGRAILADEVGLGKTIEAGLVIKEYQLRGLAKKILILVPASLVLQWTRELNEKFRIGAFAQRNEWSWSSHDVIVASIDTAKREQHRDHVLNIEWDLVVVDEAHKLKNSKTKNWQTVNQIPNKFMLLLTATPIQNDLKELHTLVTLLKPGQLGNSEEFLSAHVASARSPKDPTQLREQISNVMIRNRRRDGATALPDRHVEVVPLTLSDAERTFYNAVQDFLRGEYRERKEAKASILSLVTLQREICSSPYAALITLEKMVKREKREETKEALQSLMQLGEAITNYTKINTVLDMVRNLDDKCIIFTEYRATQDFLMYMLKQNQISAVPFRGGFGRGKKDWMKDLFARKVQVLVATESGGEGINLQFCHHMINFDLPWNPMRLEQRIGRIHRLGQQEEVFVYNLSTKDTIEEHIVKLLHEKIRMFELVIGELDYIVGEDGLAQQLEETVLDLALTSTSTDELQKRMDALGEEMLHRIETDGRLK